jgi:hypothetical protein
VLQIGCIDGKSAVLVSAHEFCGESSGEEARDGRDDTASELLEPLSPFCSHLAVAPYRFYSTLSSAQLSTPLESLTSPPSFEVRCPPLLAPSTAPSLRGQITLLCFAAFEKLFLCPIFSSHHSAPNPTP